MSKQSINKKSSTDYFEQMFEAGRPVIKEVKHKTHKNRQELKAQEVEDSFLRFIETTLVKILTYKKFLSGRVGGG